MSQLKPMCLLVLFAVMHVFSSCINLSSFQTAKPVEKGAGELSVAVGGFIVSGSFDEDAVGIPYLELAGRYGAGENVDIGLKISTISTFMFDVKVQIVGDKLSGFAMAPGPSFGYIGTITGSTGLVFSFPMHMSYHPTETFALYFTPKYNAVIITGENDLHYLGGNIGFLTGKKFQFGVDIASSFSLNPANEETLFNNFGINIFQFGFGFKFSID